MFATVSKFSLGMQNKKRGIIMKHIRLFLTILVLGPLTSITCPTCVGRIEKDSPAFFNDDFYTKTSEPQTDLDQQDVSLVEENE